MSDPTFYCVQAYNRLGERIVPARLAHYPSADDARAAAARAAEDGVGAVAFEFTGRPEFDIWGEPRLLGRFGNVPGIAA